MNNAGGGKTRLPLPAHHLGYNIHIAQERFTQGARFDRATAR